MVEYLEEIRSITLPTEDQIKNFVTYITNAHSWYKHLPLQTGSSFVLFFEPDLDRKYPTNRQLFPHFCEDKTDYFKQFGHLSFMWLNDSEWQQDFGPCRKNIPTELKKVCSLTLFPYCHYDFENAISLFKLDFQKMQQGYFYPHSDLLLKWREKFNQLNHIWENNLNETERNFLTSHDFPFESEDLIKQVTPNINFYSVIELEVIAFEEQLRTFEIQKIKQTINKLIAYFNKEILFR